MFEMGIMLIRKGFRKRVVRYVVFLLSFFSIYSFWAILFGRYEFVLATLRALPLALLASIMLDIVGIGNWMKKSRVRRSIPTVLLVIAILVISYNGELWATVPLIVMFIWIVGYVLKQQLSMRGHRATPPQI